MSLQGTRTIVSTGVPIWQDIYGENAQGGFTLDMTGLTSGTILPAGTPITFDESTRLAKPLVQATVYADAGGSATAYQVKKGSNAAVGNYLASAVGGKAYAITAIDTTNALYDTLTVGTSIGAATAGTGLFISSATGATSAALGVTPKGLLYEDVTAVAGASLSVRIKGTVYARRIPAYPAALPAALPLITFSQSY